MGFWPSFRTTLGLPLIALPAAALITGAVTFGVIMSGVVVAAPAETALGNDLSLTALRNFTQALPGKSTEADGSIGANETADQPFKALRELARRLPADATEPQASAPTSKTLKVAAADNAFDALRDFLQNGGASQGAAPARPAAAAPANGKIKNKPPLATNATYVGSKVCAGCHTSHIETFKETLMGKLFVQGKLECETCHGPGSAHAKAGGGRGVGGIRSFRADDDSHTPQENNAICLGCHEKGDRINWAGSPHETRDIACTNCHTVMKAVSRKFNLKTAFEPDTCFQCHKDRRAQMFRSSHMPVREGKIVCSDCHNPHGSFTESLLRTDSVNDTCYKCHAEKRGPFLFEHLPVRENCLNCHDPHGSVNEFMLKISRPRLCAECHGFGHGLTSGVNSVQFMSRSCQNCHTEIHGTNSPSGALLHR